MIKLGCCIDSADIEPAYETGYDFIDLSGAELASMPRESKVKYLHIADPAGRRYPSESSDENLFRLMQNAIRMTDCEYIAIEALSNDIRTDARKGCHFLKSKINHIIGG